MTRPAIRPPPDDLYETDFYAWTQTQAAALRAGRDRELDIANLVDEAETLGRNRRRAIASHLEVLLAHLLKCIIQPGRRTASWDRTIADARREIEAEIARSPSLADHPREVYEAAYRAGARRAVRETGLDASTFPPQPPFSLDEALDPLFQTSPAERSR